MQENRVSEAVIGAAIEVHRHLGPGLVEVIYEEALCREFSLRGLRFERQVPVPVEYKGAKLGLPLRLDLFVEDKVIVELKAKQEIIAFDRAQLLSYLRLTGARLGLILNFHALTMKEGVHRVANGLPPEPLIPGSFRI
ncbi:MAG: GxxExxY protein [Verrucomicrobiota bacterium]